MKWGKKKWLSPSSHPSLISHVFPISWLTKLKPNKGICSNEIPVRAKHKGQKDLVLGSSSKCSLLAEEGCFYNVDDDPYWRLSFGKETAKKSKDGLNSAWFDKDMKEAKKSQTWKLNGKMKEMQYMEEILQEDEAIRRKRVNEEEYQAKTRRNSRTLKEKQSQRGTEQRASKEAEKIIFDVQPEDRRKRRSFSFPNCTVTSIEQECLLEVQNLDESLETLEDIKVKRMLSKQDEITGSISKDINYQKKRRYQKRRTKAFSPRTSAKIECKIKGLEDMKKFRMRKKKTADNMVFNSYAVVKNSFDPKSDFRESMIEMIVMKEIERPEELEKLLACYLTLNCDEYHEIIIKIFRQVWFELNEVYHLSELQNPHCYEHEHDQLF